MDALNIRCSNCDQTGGKIVHWTMAMCCEGNDDPNMVVDFLMLLTTLCNCNNQLLRRRNRHSGGSLENAWIVVSVRSKPKDTTSSMTSYQRQSTVILAQRLLLSVTKHLDYCHWRTTWRTG
jgi:hypothetical protein